MAERIEALPEEKRTRILSACLDEFAAKGYDKANTNEIVKKAGISKGLLFHYFGSKKHMYLYIADRALKTVGDAAREAMHGLPEDILEMVAEISAVKMRVALEYPRETKVLFDAYLNTPEVIRDDIEKEYAGVFEVQKEKFITLMDKSRLRDDVTPEQAYDLIYACAQGAFSPIVGQHEDVSIEEAMERIERYRQKALTLLRLLKKAIYKE